MLNILPRYFLKASGLIFVVVNLQYLFFKVCEFTFQQIRYTHILDFIPCFCYFLSQGVCLYHSVQFMLVRTQLAVICSPVVIIMVFIKFMKHLTKIRQILLSQTFCDKFCTSVFDETQDFQDLVSFKDCISGCIMLLEVYDTKSLFLKI